REPLVAEDPGRIVRQAAVLAGLRQHRLLDLRLVAADARFGRRGALPEPADPAEPDRGAVVVQEPLPRAGPDQRNRLQPLPDDDRLPARGLDRVPARG